MQYQGGKHYSATGIAKTIGPYLSSGGDYYEPFCGALHATLAIAPYVQGNLRLSDSFQDLIDLWGAVRDGFRMPPIDKAEYARLRSGPPSPERTAAGFGLSFSGTWFGGFIQDRPQHSIYPLQALNRSMDVRRTLLNKPWVSIRACDYTQIEPKSGDVVYCDPPYRGTCGYPSVGQFDSDRFWEWASVLSRRGVKVVVSEYSAPPDFTSIFQKTVVSRIKSFGHHKKVTHRVQEQVWVYNPGEI